MEMLRKYLSQYEPLTDEQFELIAAKIRECYLKKGAYFLRQGEVCRKIGFVTEGILRVYFQNDTTDTTCYFIKENQFAVNIKSFNEQRPADDNKQAVTDVRLLVLGYDSMQMLLNVIPAWPTLVQKITEHTLLAKINRRSPMVAEDARTRYERFMREQPDVLARVPLRYVASYLGITQPSLSRLRKEIMETTS